MLDKINCLIPSFDLREGGMAGSSVFQHYEFLKNLGREDNVRVRIQRVRSMDVDTMKALSKIVYFILMNFVPSAILRSKSISNLSTGYETYQQSNRLALKEKDNFGTIPLSDSQTSS